MVEHGVAGDANVELPQSSLEEVELAENATRRRMVRCQIDPERLANIDKHG